MTPCNCDQNRRQAEIIKRLWHLRVKDRKQIEAQQYIIDQLRQPEPLTAKDRAEQAFEGQHNGKT